MYCEQCGYKFEINLQNYHVKLTLKLSFEINLKIII